MNSVEPWAAENLSLMYDVIVEHENDTDLSNLNAGNLSDWGPKRDPLFIVIPFTILFTTIFLTGLIGNVSTCIVIARNKSMHTATNYYLFSLAISDLLLLISGLPQEIYYIWSKYPYIFGETICVLQGFAAETSANATVLTITAFTVERYVAICHPFLSHTMSKLSRAVKLVIMIWTFAICLAIPQAMAFGIVYEKLYEDDIENDDHYTCNVKRIVIPHAFLISTVLFFVTPMSLITVLYILIGLQLRQSTVGPVRGGSIKMNNLVHKRSSVVTYTGKSNHSTLITSDPESANLQLSPQEEDDRRNCPNQTQASSQHVVKMLVAVVVAFFICWAPFHAQRLLAIYGQSDSSDMVATFSALTYISGVLYYLSTTINPVLYHIMSHKFRMAFKETYARCLLKRRQTRIPPRYSTLSRRSSQDKGNSNSLSKGNLFDSRSEQALSRHFKQKKRILYKSERNIVYLNRELNKNSRRVSADLRFQCNLIKSNGDKNFSVKNGTLRNHCRSVNALLENNPYKLEEIEMFRMEALSVKTIKRLKDVNVMEEGNCGSRRRSTSFKLETESNNKTNINKILIKSFTMPNIRMAYTKMCLENFQPNPKNYC